jgi:hypothetical protein
MTTCRRCSTEHPEGTQYCGRCGLRLEDAQSDSDPLVGQVFRDRYEVLERIGTGGFGTVYRVRNLTLDTIEALKIIHAHVAIDPKQIERFRQEAQLLRRLSAASEHVPELYDFDQDPERKLRYFTLEFLDGTGLRRLIRDEGALPLGRALDIMRQVCSALIAAHGQTPPIIHRDLKPDNVMLLSKEGQDSVKILDFGIAKIVGHDSLTETGQGMGSYGYMPPEQISGEDIDARTDLFAAGVTFYNMVTARDPWIGRSLADSLSPSTRMKLLDTSRFGEPIPPSEAEPDIPPALEALILKLLDKDPALRVQTAAEVEEALGQIEVGKEQASVGARLAIRAASPSTLAGLSKRWRPLAPILATAIGLAIVGYLFSVGPLRAPLARLLSPAESVSSPAFLAEVSDGRISELVVKESGELEARQTEEAGGETLRVERGETGFQELLRRIRAEGVSIIGEAKTGQLRILAPPGSTGSGAATPAISLQSDDYSCSPCPLEEPIELPAGWYEVDSGSGDGGVSAAIIGTERLGRAEPVDVPGTVFLAGGLTTALELSLTAATQARLATLISQTRDHLAAGRLDEALDQVAEALEAYPTDEDADRLQTRIAAAYLTRAEESLEKSAWADARSAAERCLGIASAPDGCAAIRDSALRASASSTARATGGPRDEPIVGAREAESTTGALGNEQAGAADITDDELAGDGAVEVDPEAAAFAGSWWFSDSLSRGEARCTRTSANLSLIATGAQLSGEVSLTETCGISAEEFVLQLSGRVEDGLLDLEGLRQNDPCRYSASSVSPDGVTGSVSCDSGREGTWSLQVTDDG